MSVLVAVVYARLSYGYERVYKIIATTKVIALCQ